ncbi:MAG: cupin domain-containing protein [Aureispira sp.]|nr:cupin domain-containing protein [Aureispira sp.]
MNVQIKDVLRLPGEGERTHSDMVIKARTEDLAGDFSVMEGVIRPNEIIAPHTHEHEAQLVYVITGELEFEVGGAEGLRFSAPAGSYIIKPKGVMHSFWNKKDVESRYIELSGKEYFEGFVDSKAKGNIHAITHAKKYGMTTHMKDTFRLMKVHKLTGLSSMEFPSLPKLPDWLKKLLPSRK